jgi:hypothetical protein
MFINIFPLTFWFYICCVKKMASWQQLVCNFFQFFFFLGLVIIKFLLVYICNNLDLIYLHYTRYQSLWKGLKKRSENIRDSFFGLNLKNQIIFEKCFFLTYTLLSIIVLGSWVDRYFFRLLFWRYESLWVSFLHNSILLDEELRLSR